MRDLFVLMQDLFVLMLIEPWGGAGVFKRGLGASGAREVRRLITKEH